MPRFKVIAERVLTYRRSRREQWSAGDKSLFVSAAGSSAMIRNQPRYHFGEHYCLRWFNIAGGWEGNTAYSLGTRTIGGRYSVGTELVRKVVPATRLAAMQAIRGDRLVGGEPDLFLYRTDGLYRFVEVKKQSDRLNRQQLRTIAEILATLECPVDIVYLREIGQRYRAKSYEFDQDTLEGRRID